MNVSAKKSNPGREIMLKVVRKRERSNPWSYPHTVEGYIKATEKIVRKEKKEKDKKPRNVKEISDSIRVRDSNSKAAKDSQTICK